MAIGGFCHVARRAAGHEGSRIDPGADCGGLTLLGTRGISASRLASLGGAPVTVPGNLPVQDRPSGGCSPAATRASRCRAYTPVVAPAQ